MEQAFKVFRNLEAITKYWLRNHYSVVVLLASYVEEAKQERHD